MARKLRRELETRVVERLVVDLRDNGGGNSFQFSYLVLRDLRRRADLNRRERLFVLINGGTFSSAMNNALQMSRETEVILVGEPTGGSPNAFGEMRRLELPNSRIPVWYSTKAFQLIPGRPDATTVEPEIEIQLTSEAHFGGRDPVLEAVLERAASSAESVDTRPGVVLSLASHNDPA